MPFRDRIDAGRQLAERLLPYISKRPLILALPRGGVPVGYEIAAKFGLPLDTLVVRKIGAPNNPEFAVGALAPDGVSVVREAALRSLGITMEDIEPVIESERREMARRITRYKSGDYSKDADARTIVIVDDGLATGATALVAVQWIKKTLSPKKIIIAVPVCARDTADHLRTVADDVVCVQETDDLVAIGYWYKAFEQTTDEEVIHCLKKANASRDHTAWQ
ncbi:MAG TPA: phosphoribosyltransferase [Candidatus Paceibacterota bacterium]|nr:phosphoribosyltransferase [Candidatus Paceibacterota bacterium]